MLFQQQLLYGLLACDVALVVSMQVFVNRLIISGGNAKPFECYPSCSVRNQLTTVGMLIFASGISVVGSRATGIIHCGC
jgi:hypothetical protein